jgi:hypothetical protein
MQKNQRKNVVNGTRHSGCGRGYLGGRDYRVELGPGPGTRGVTGSDLDERRRAPWEDLHLKEPTWMLNVPKGPSFVS